MTDHTTTIFHQSEVRVSEYMSKVYGWMTGALAISALVAWRAANYEPYTNYIMSHSNTLFIMMIAEIGLVIYLAARIHKMSLQSAIVAFVLYSVFNGLTFATIFFIYPVASIAKTFVITAGMFGVMGLYGYTTKKDLSGWGGFLYMSLIGIIIASVVNMFLGSHMLDWIVTYAGVILFSGLTAYDHQKLKHIGAMGHEGSMLGKMVILGALTLYLDFINLFLFLLRIFGGRD